MNFLLEIKDYNIPAKAITRTSDLSANRFGIVIGITSVTLMQTAIEGINRAFEKVYRQ